MTGLGMLLHNSQCCSTLLAHARPTMFYIPYTVDILHVCVTSSKFKIGVAYHASL